MARATYIYNVLNADPRTWPLIASFTVKHELITWAKNHPDVGEGLDWHVVRVRDGQQATHDTFEGAPRIWDYIQEHG